MIAAYPLHYVHDRSDEKWRAACEGILRECAEDWQVLTQLPPAEVGLTPIGLEDAVDLFFGVVTAPCQEKVVAGLEERLLFDVTGWFWEYNREEKLHNFEGLTLHLEHYLKKLLLLCEQETFRKLHDRKLPNLWDVVVALQLVPPRVLQKSYPPERLKEESRLVQLVARTQDLIRNPVTHACETVTDRQVAQYFVDLMLVYLLAASKYNTKLQEVLPRDDRAPVGFHDSRAPYIAHTYTLSKSTGLIGRQKELDLLSNWTTSTGDSIFVLVAMGGMGKSALTWKWFQDVAPQVMKPMAGRMWWSFYEEDGSFKNFVARAYAYVSGQSLYHPPTLSYWDQKRFLLDALQERPYLIVLDGLERILRHYSRPDAAYQPDSEEELSRRRRQAVDVQAGLFLQELARAQRSRILISTRLFPADLETDSGRPIRYSHLEQLTGLSVNDAFALWQALDVHGSEEAIKPYFKQFDYYPLLIKVLAREVAAYYPARCDFDAWLKAHPHFDPFNLKLKQVKTHVLDVALAGLSRDMRRTLEIIAGFRMPLKWNTLIDLCNEVADEDTEKDDKCETTPRSEEKINKCLRELSGRGLTGWDEKKQQCDLHPVVRGVVWEKTDAQAKQRFFNALIKYCEKKEPPSKITNFEELNPHLLLFHARIGSLDFHQAYEVFYNHLDDGLYYQFAAGEFRQELLHKLLPSEEDSTSGITSQRPHPALVLHALAKGEMFNGRLDAAVKCFIQALEQIETFGEEYRPLKIRFTKEEYTFDEAYPLAVLVHAELAHAYRLSGQLRSAEESSRKALEISRQLQYRFLEGAVLYRLGLVLSARGSSDEADMVLHQSLEVWQTFQDLLEKSAQPPKQGSRTTYRDLVGFVHYCLAQHALWLGNLAEAREQNQAAVEQFEIDKSKNNLISAARLEGMIALAEDDLVTAENRFEYALKEARAGNRVEEELQILAGWAELHRLNGHFNRARELLQRIWEPAKQGPYRMYHADALIVLSKLERDESRTEQAVEAATQARELALGDGSTGEDFAYRWGLENARQLLHEMGAVEPGNIQHR